ncbi:uncharacterized protein LOC134533250 isoform X2 [Bacillus rossius redtenbacheri]|uniref:uncharacterized protein LOC134533250 isoform X2 n=1 Tax=Bacillus rossius redtenbacheri TaxID=93214 RepID=UPI002FDD1DF1
MEIMEEGNMMDRVRILLQRDLDYYRAHQTVLQENLCPGVVGGLLDFPRYASFAAVKLVLWWEQEYVAAFRQASGLLETGAGGDGGEQDTDKGCGGVAMDSAPDEFVSVVTDSAGKLLQHLHALSQEALDHADLTVLTGTLGAAALVKNCLWCYNEQLKRTAGDKPLTLHGGYKQFHEMAEALAERLLDLHCRLLSLYILQDADCLHWEDPHPFFEGERGSFVVQMWWLYMQGTREDLWNTVPPKMAQRVLAGMLNESLTILTVRYTQATPSRARGLLLGTDVSNVLLCVRQLLPAVCGDSEELVGRRLRSKVLRDVHAKCHQLLCCLLARACPLPVLYKFLRRGLTGVAAFCARDPTAVAPWFTLTSPDLFPDPRAELRDGAAVALELSVLAAQPQACWPVLLKVLMMRHCKVANLVMKYYAPHVASDTAPASKSVLPVEQQNTDGRGRGGELGQCGGFLCPGGGACVLGPPSTQALAPGLVVASLVHVVAGAGGPADLASVLLPVLGDGPGAWGSCLDHRQVWNQCRPPWLEALLKPLESLMTPIVLSLLDIVQVDDSTAECVQGLAQLADCLPPSVPRAAALLEDWLPADVSPAGGSVLLQLLLAALYSRLAAGGPDLAALAESLCHLGPGSRHAPHLRHFLEAAADSEQHLGDDYSVMEAAPYMEEVLVSKLLFTAYGKSSLKVLWQFLQHSSRWVLGQLRVLGEGEAPAPHPPAIPAATCRPASCPLLHTAFHVGGQRFDQLLAGTWAPDWGQLLCTPLGLATDQFWSQLSRRAEFREPAERLSEHDATVVAALSSLFASAPPTPGRSRCHL